LVEQRVLLGGHVLPRVHAPTSQYDGRMPRQGSSGNWIAMGILASAMACGGQPPPFSVEREPAPPGDAAEGRWISIGSLATPPPGLYRFVRLQARGEAAVREVHAVNGPGPWTTYVGRARVATGVATDALGAVSTDVPGSSPASGAEPCVLAFGSGAAIQWQGCAYDEVARRVLAELPPLGFPDVNPDCAAPMCQLRLIDGATPTGHASAIIRRDVVLDSDGTVWCAAQPDEPTGTTGVQRVERASIDRRDAPGVFAWLTRGVTDAAAGAGARDALTRAAGTAWRPVGPADARMLRSRWQQLAPSLPTACR
jgi:hypothetical protein